MLKQRSQDLDGIDEDGVGIGTTANGYSLNVIGGTKVSGVITATKFVGDGSLLTSVNVSAAGWTNITSGTPILYITANPPPPLIPPLGPPP